jgi:hypothetical protein
MNDHQRLTAALIQRADEDAEKFRAQNPEATPNDLWIENSYTAALPLAKDDAGFDPGRGPHPDLFAAYRAEIVRRVGEHSNVPAPGER